MPRWCTWVHCGTYHGCVIDGRVEAKVATRQGLGRVEPQRGGGGAVKGEGLAAQRWDGLCWDSAEWVPVVCGAHAQTGRSVTTTSTCGPAHTPAAPAHQHISNVRM